MIDTKEAAKKWGVTKRTVYAYCNEGVIPGAFKEGKEWCIPDIDKPPARRNGIVKYLNILNAINEGAEPNFNAEREFARKMFRYISDQGFSTKIEIPEDIFHAIKGISITSLGMQLIKKENESSHVEVETAIKGEINSGVVNAGISHTKKKINSI